jgi:hypothetical protein
LPTKLHEFEEAIRKGESLPRGTIKKFQKLNIGVDDGVILEICMAALRDGYEIIKKYHNNGDLSITFQTMNGDPAHERGLYLLWKHDRNQWKLGAVTLLSSYLLNRVRPQLPEECDPTEYSKVVATLTQLKALADKEDGKLWGYVDQIIEKAATFTVYEDHEDNNRDEVLIFLMEFIFSACIPDVHPGYILERPLLVGSKSMRDLVRLPQHTENGFLVDVYKKLQKQNDNNPNGSRLTLLHTWETIMSAIAVAMRLSLEKETESLNEARAMFEAACKNLFMEGEYMQKFLTKDLSWQGGERVNGFRVVDAVPCPIFEQVKKVLQPLVALIDDVDEKLTRPLVLDEKHPLHSEIREILKSYSAIKMVYKAPDQLETRYVEGLEKLLQELKASPFSTEVVETERTILHTIGEVATKKFLKGDGVAAINARGKTSQTRLYTTAQGQKEVYIIVTSSAHPILSIQSGGGDWDARTRNASDLTLLMGARVEAGLIDKKKAERDCRMLLSSLVNADPHNDIGRVEGDDEYMDYETDSEDEEEYEGKKKKKKKKKKDGRQIVSFRKSLPEGYLKGKYCGTGVQELAHATHLGLDAYHITAMMGVLGYNRFLRFVDIWLGQNFTPPDDVADLTYFFGIKFCMSRIELAKSKVCDAMEGMSEDADDEEVKRVADIISGIEESDEKLKSSKRVRSFVKNKEEYTTQLRQIRQTMIEFDETKAGKLLSVMEGDVAESFKFLEYFGDLSDLEDELSN